MEKNNNVKEQPLYPVKYVQVLRGGTAHVILFNDGKEYVVKWFGVKKERGKEVVNEYVVAKLAQLLSLPNIPFKLVYIPEYFLKKTPELQQKSLMFFTKHQRLNPYLIGKGRHPSHHL
jgi:hypothetical protein